MEELEIFDKLKESKYYIKQLNIAIDNDDDFTIARLITIIDLELKSIRKVQNDKIKRENEMCKDFNKRAYLKSKEDITALINEFNDLLDLFKLAQICKSEQLMYYEYNKMIQCLNEILKKSEKEDINRFKSLREQLERIKKDVKNTLDYLYEKAECLDFVPNNTL